MSIAGDEGGTFTREYLEDGISRLQDEDAEAPTPENEEAIRKAEEALEELGE